MPACPILQGREKACLDPEQHQVLSYSAWCKLLQPLSSARFTTLCLRWVGAGLCDAAEDELHFLLPFSPPCLVPLWH